METTVGYNASTIKIDYSILRERWRITIKFNSGRLPLTTAKSFSGGPDKAIAQAENFLRERNMSGAVGVVSISIRLLYAQAMDK